APRHVGGHAGGAQESDGSGSQQFAQHIGQDAPVQVVVHFGSGIDAQQHGYVLHRAVAAVDGQGDVLLRLDAVFEPRDVVGFLARNAQRFDAVVALELQGQNTHADQIAAVDAFE